jgi:hypothetical protein
MKKLITICLVCVLTTSAWGMLNITFDENSHGTYDYDGGVSYPLSWGIDTPPIGHETLYYVLPFTPVNEGDVLVMEPTEYPTPIISDVLRFLNVSEQARVYVYSDNSDGIDALADTGIPTQWMSASVQVNEIGNEGFNYAVYVVTDFATYKLISDVPEPATIGLLGLGALAFLRKRSA